LEASFTVFAAELRIAERLSNATGYRQIMFFSVTALASWFLSKNNFYHLVIL
jgi:hypothetical protein